MLLHPSLDGQKHPIKTVAELEEVVQALPTGTKYGRWLSGVGLMGTIAQLILNQAQYNFTGLTNGGVVLNGDYTSWRFIAPKSVGKTIEDILRESMPIASWPAFMVKKEFNSSVPSWDNFMEWTTTVADKINQMVSGKTFKIQGYTLATNAEYPNNISTFSDFAAWMLSSFKNSEANTNLTCIELLATDCEIVKTVYDIDLYNGDTYANRSITISFEFPGITNPYYNA